MSYIEMIRSHTTNTVTEIPMIVITKYLDSFVNRAFSPVLLLSLSF